MNLEHSSSNSDPDAEALGRVASEAVEQIRSVPAPRESMARVMERAMAWSEGAEAVYPLRRRRVWGLSAIAAGVAITLLVQTMLPKPARVVEVTPTNSPSAQSAPVPDAPALHTNTSDRLTARARPPVPPAKPIAVGTEIKTQPGER